MNTCTIFHGAIVVSLAFRLPWSLWACFVTILGLGVILIAKGRKPEAPTAP